MAQLKDTLIDGSLELSGTATLGGTLYSQDIEGFGSREVFCPISSAGNTTINYGSYEEGLGGTNIYGNKLSFMSKTTIETEQPVEVHSFCVLPSEKVSITTAYTRIPFKQYNYSGRGAEFFTCVTDPYVGVRCNRSGKIKASACAHAQGIGAGESVGISLYKNGTMMGGLTYETTPTTRTYAAPVFSPIVFSVAEGDVIGLIIYNLQTSTGEVAAYARTRMTLEYLY